MGRLSTTECTYLPPSTPSVQLSSTTWPISSVQVQLGSEPVSMSEPNLGVASWSQEDPAHRRAEHETPRETAFTTEGLAARGDTLLALHLRLRQWESLKNKTN